MYMFNNHCLVLQPTVLSEAMAYILTACTFPIPPVPSGQVPRQIGQAMIRSRASGSFGLVPNELVLRGPIIVGPVPRGMIIVGFPEWMSHRLKYESIYRHLVVVNNSQVATARLRRCYNKQHLSIHTSVWLNFEIKIDCSQQRNVISQNYEPQTESISYDLNEKIHLFSQHFLKS